MEQVIKVPSLSLELPCDLAFDTFTEILDNYDVRIENCCECDREDEDNNNGKQYIFFEYCNEVGVECHLHYCENCFDGHLAAWACGGTSFSVYRVNHTMKTCELAESNGTFVMPYLPKKLRDLWRTLDNGNTIDNLEQIIEYYKNDM